MWSFIVILAALTVRSVQVNCFTSPGDHLLHSKISLQTRFFWVRSFLEDKDLDIKRLELKQALIKQCQSTDNAQNQRMKVQDILNQLAPLSPEKTSSTSPLLRKTWNLVWTTEKEINFFIDKGISSKVSQTISNDGLDLSNSIAFTGGGGLFVTGTLTTSDLLKDTKDTNPKRTYFKFNKAQLVTSFGKISFPPVGEGWFDTIYLDKDLRCDTNSRNDILICTCT